MSGCPPSPDDLVAALYGREYSLLTDLVGIDVFYRKYQVSAEPWCKLLAILGFEVNKGFD